MSNVAFIGESDLIKGLGMVGAGVFGIEKKEDLPSLLEGLVKQGCRVVFILEKWAKVAQDVIDAYRDKFISIVIVPDYRRDFGICKVSIKNAIVDAVGADILKGE